jgi:hypothetical protein
MLVAGFNLAHLITYFYKMRNINVGFRLMAMRNEILGIVFSLDEGHKIFAM